MDKKRILEEGLLERYLLGELSPEEEIAVENVLQADEALRSDFDALEADFERIAFENAVDPPLEVRAGLEAQIMAVPETTSEPGTPRSRYRRVFWAAASVAFLFTLGMVWMYSQWQRSEEDLRALEIRTSALQERLLKLEANYVEAKDRYQNINNPNVIPLLLIGNEKSPASRATVYVNHSTKEVIVNASGLRELSKGLTYQMWADVDGVMIDMGVVKTDEDYSILRYVDHAESLNITIEPAGGNEHPTVENLISNVLL